MIPARLCLVIASAACLPAILSAQALEPGDRIRGRYCEASTCRTIEGAFVSRDTDSVRVTIRAEGASFPGTIGARDATVARGTRRHALTGALMGAVVGIGVGAGVQGSSCGEGCGIPVAAGAGIGIVVGSFLGRMMSADRWVPLPAAAPGGLSLTAVTLAPAALAGHPGIGVRFTFQGR